MDRQHLRDSTRLCRLVGSAKRRRLADRRELSSKRQSGQPHDYGQHNGVIKLLAWQLGGSSSGPLPNWRWMEQDGISNIQPLNETFPGGRPTASGKHHKWDKLFIRVKPAKKSRK